MLIPRVPFPKVPTAVFFAMADALPRGRMSTPVAPPAPRPVTLGDPGPPPVPPAECGAPAASGPIAPQGGRAGIQAPVGALQETERNQDVSRFRNGPEAPRFAAGGCHGA